VKCPKCGYLGFEEVDRCRNCGHDFTVTTSAVAPDLSLRRASAGADELFDLELALPGNGPERPTVPSGSTPALQRADDLQAGSPADLPLFGKSDAGADHLAMLSRATAPRAPLAVRRATPEAPRVRVDTPRTPMLDLASTQLPMPEPPPKSAPPKILVPAPSQPAVPHTLVSRPILLSSNEPAGLGLRIAAAMVDLALLAVIDGVVIYFTLQILGLQVANLWLLPKAPLVAFLLLQNCGYLAAFTAGGQTLGKMSTGIRVVSDEGAALDLGRSLKRTFVWALLAIPAGLGFATAFFDADRRGLHDRLAGTRVVRADA